MSSASSSGDQIAGRAVFELRTDKESFDRDLRGAEKQVEKSGSRIQSILNTSIGSALGFAAANYAMGAVNRTFSLISSSIIGMNAQLETSQLQFAILMKDAQRAEQHVKDLFDFAQFTPFETAPIIQASRLMQTFGGDALNTKENLTLIGDAAAAASRDIAELGFWVARSYSLIQGGQPFGEAALRMQEMGILTTEARTKMEKLRKEGADGEEVWKVLQAELRKTTGAMEDLASTWQGVTSTFADSVQIVAADVTRPLFEDMRDGLAGINAMLESPAFLKGAELFGQMLTFALGLTKSLPLVAVALVAVGSALTAMRVAAFVGTLIEAHRIAGQFGGTMQVLRMEARRVGAALVTPKTAAIGFGVALLGVDVALRKVTGHGLLDWLTGAAARADRLTRVMERLGDAQERYARFVALGASQDVARRATFEEQAEGMMSATSELLEASRELDEARERAAERQEAMIRSGQGEAVGWQLVFQEVAAWFGKPVDEVNKLEQEIGDLNKVMEVGVSQLREMNITHEELVALLEKYPQLAPHVNELMEELAADAAKIAKAQREANEVLEEFASLQRTLTGLAREGVDSDQVRSISLDKYGEALSNNEQAMRSLMRAAEEAALDPLVSLAAAMKENEEEMAAFKERQGEVLAAILELNPTYEELIDLTERYPALSETLRSAIDEQRDAFELARQAANRYNAELRTLHGMALFTPEGADHLTTPVLERAHEAITSGTFQGSAPSTAPAIPPRFDAEAVGMIEGYVEDANAALGLLDPKAAHKAFREVLKDLDAEISGTREQMMLLEQAGKTQTSTYRNLAETVDALGFARERVNLRARFLPDVAEVRGFNEELLALIDTFTSRAAATFDLPAEEAHKAFGEVQESIGDARATVQLEMQQMAAAGTDTGAAWDALVEKLRALDNAASQVSLMGTLNLPEIERDTERFTSESLTLIAGFAARANEILEGFDADNVVESYKAVRGEFSGLQAEIASDITRYTYELNQLSLQGEDAKEEIEALAEKIDALRFSAQNLRLLEAMALDEVGEEVRELLTLMGRARREADTLGRAAVTALQRQARAELDDALTLIDARQQALEDSHRRRIALIDEEQRRVNAAIQAELDALDALDQRERLQSLQRQLALAVDPLERARVQEEIRQHGRNAERNALREAQRDYADAFNEERQRLEEELGHKVSLLGQERDEAQKHYREITDAYALQTEARRLLEEEHQDELVALLESYYPEWETAGLSFGQQLVDGLKNSGIETYVDGLHARITDVETRAASIEIPEIPVVFEGGGSMPETETAVSAMEQSETTTTEGVAEQKIEVDVGVQIGDEQLDPHVTKVVKKTLEGEVEEAQEYGHRAEEATV